MNTEDHHGSAFGTWIIVILLVLLVLLILQPQVQLKHLPKLNLELIPPLKHRFKHLPH